MPSLPRAAMARSEAGVSKNCACRSLSASVRAAVVGAAVMGRAVVMEAMVMGTMDQQDRTADPIEPRVPPVEWLGVRIKGDRLWWQRVDLLRQSRRIDRDLPTAIGLSARLPDSLSRLPFNRDLRGEVAAILKGLYWNKCCVRRARGYLPATARQGRQQCDSQNRDAHINLPKKSGT
jgi:hypothetical protein